MHSRKRCFDSYDNDVMHCVNFDNNNSTVTAHNVNNDNAGSHYSKIDCDY